MVLFNKNYLTIEVDKNNDCLIQLWKGFATPEQFREGILKALELFKQQKVSKMISDTKDQAIVRKEETDFAVSTVPEFIKSGLKAFAFVVPTSVFTQMSLNNFKKNSDTSFAIQYFDEMKKAKDWISNG